MEVEGKLKRLSRKIPLGAGFQLNERSQLQLFSPSYRHKVHGIHRLVGLVVKASSSRAEGPGFESRLRRDFFGVESYQ